MFAEVLGIRPWEWDHLSALEAISLADYIDELNKRASDDG